MYFFLDAALFPAHIAQSVEHILGKNEVIGSSPIVGSPMFVKMPARGVQELPRRALGPARYGVRINTRRQRPAEKDGFISPDVRTAIRRPAVGDAHKWAEHKQFGCLQETFKEAFFQCLRQYLSGQSPM